MRVQKYSLGTLRPLPSAGSERTSLLLIKTVTSVVAAFREMASATSSIYNKESEGSLSYDGSFCRCLGLVLGPENRKGLGGGFALKISPSRGESRLETAPSWHVEMDTVAQGAKCSGRETKGQLTVRETVPPGCRVNVRGFPREDPFFLGGGPTKVRKVRT